MNVGRSLAIAGLLAASPLAAGCGGQSPEDCGPGTSWSGEICADTVIVDFTTCTRLVATNLTQEQKVRLEAEVAGALRAVSGKGAVEFVDTLVRNTTDTVNLKMIDTCVELAQRSGNTPVEVKSQLGTIRPDIQEKIGVLPNVSLTPTRGPAGDWITVKGANWPANQEVIITGFDGVKLATAQAGRSGAFSIRVRHAAGTAIPAARVGSQQYGTITVSPKGSDPGSALSVTALYEIVPDPSSSRSGDNGPESSSRSRPPGTPTMSR